MLRSRTRSNKMRSLIAALAALSVFLPHSQARATDAGPYLGLGGGGANYQSFDELCRDATGALPGQPVDVDCEGDETVFGWKLFAGWRFNPYLAVEGGYADLGEADADTVFFGQNPNAEISADALFAELVGSVPLGERFKAFAKLGIANIDVKLKSDVFAVPLAGTPRSSLSTDSTEAVYGLGGEFSITPGIAGRLEWERFDFDDGIDLFSISILFRPGRM